MFSLNILVSINPALHLSSCSRGDPDYKGNVVSNATFSKIFSPGNRIGWLEAPQRVVNKVLNRYGTCKRSALGHMDMFHRRFIEM